MSAVIFRPSARAASIFAIAWSIFGPVARAGRLEVIDLGGDLRLAADADQLVHCLEQAVALAAQVGDVLAADTARATLHSSISSSVRGVERRRVDERRADAERARLHLLAHERPHLVELLPAWASCPRGRSRARGWSSRRRTRPRSARCRAAPATPGTRHSVVQVMSYLMSPICFDRALLHRVVERAHRAAFAEDLRRHALPDFALGAAVGDQRVRRPRQHVDEARCDRQAGRHRRPWFAGVPFERRRSRRCGRRGSRRRRGGRAAGAVVYGSVADDDVELLDIPLPGGARQNGDGQREHGSEGGGTHGRHYSDGGNDSDGGNGKWKRGE